MSKFVDGMIIGGAAVAAGAYLAAKNKDKGRKLMEGGKDVLNKAEDYIDMAEKKMFNAHGYQDNGLRALWDSFGGKKGRFSDCPEFL